MGIEVTKRVCSRCGITRLRAGNTGRLCGACERATERSVLEAPVLPAGFWLRPDVVAACAAWDMGTLLRLYLWETGLSEERVGALVGRSQAQVNRLIRGKNQCFDIRVITRTAEVLGCPPVLLGLAPPDLKSGVTVEAEDGTGGDPTKRRQALGLGAAGIFSAAAGDNAKIGSGDVRKIRQVVQDLFRQDARYGGGALADVASRYFVRAQSVLSRGLAADGRVERELQQAAAEIGEAAGWMAFDAGRDQLARTNYTEALHIANVAGDEQQAVHILMSMSLQVAHERPHEAVQLAQYAQRRAQGWATPYLMAELSLREARAWANKGEPGEFRKAIIRAKQHFQQGPHEDDPWWLYYMDYSHLLAVEAHSYDELEKYRRAEDYYRLNLSQKPPGLRRNRALSSVGLAKVTLAQGGARQAAQIGQTDIVPVLGEITSARVLRQAAELRRDLTPYVERDPKVADFTHAFDRAMAARRHNAALV